MLLAQDCCEKPFKRPCLVFPTKTIAYSSENLINYHAQNNSNIIEHLQDSFSKLFNKNDTQFGNWSFIDYNCSSYSDLDTIVEIFIPNDINSSYIRDAREYLKKLGVNSTIHSLIINWDGLSNDNLNNGNLHSQMSIFIPVWNEIENLLKQGFIINIGVSGISLAALELLLKVSEIKPNLIFINKEDSNEKLMDLSQKFNVKILYTKIFKAPKNFNVLGLKKNNLDFLIRYTIVARNNMLPLNTGYIFQSEIEK
ncbi:hypothetical protein HDU92_000918 [Lobulomyces angularis]|nr:hypothetical protein HDU92_000918 [Lobulomyces angularis]